MKILIVEDVERWEKLIIFRLDRKAEIVVARSVSELEVVLASDQKFFATALDAWLEDSTFRFLSKLLEISKFVISTSQDVKCRNEMVRLGCHAGGNKWDFVNLLDGLCKS